MHNYKHIFISGASRGVGRSLALEFASPDVTIGICARNPENLKAIENILKKKGAMVHSYCADVQDHKKMNTAIRNFLKKTGKIDLVIANAGTMLPIHDRLYSLEDLHEIIDVNTKGVINTVRPFFEKMLEQGYGHCVHINSIAGFFGVPGGTYGASKSAARIMFNTWRSRFHGHNIRFTTLCPGFIKTDLLKDPGYKLYFLMTPEKAAKKMKKAILKKKNQYVFPLPLAMVAQMGRMLPWPIQRIIFKSTEPGLDATPYRKQK